MKRVPHPYRGQSVALATKHAKERAIAPPLAANPGLRVILATVDTDLFGTFTGEVERTGSPRDTALAKARLGLATTGLPRALASEGSFGPHPTAFFLNAGQELLAFVDAERGIEVVEARLSLRTNFAQITTTSADDLDGFLRSVRFGTHGLIVRPNHAGADGPLYKGLRTYPELHGAVKRCARASADGLARVETDMRAHHNPTRRREIALLARELARRLTERCPSCGTPAWGRMEVTRGLPCETCETPTDLIRAEIHGCPVCDHRVERPRSDGLTRASAAWCSYCNP